MKSFAIAAALTLTGLFLASCAGTATEAPLTLAPDRPTFVFFFTDT